MKNIIETHNLTFEHKDEDEKNVVLYEINLSVKNGEFLCVLGHNGSGKSTLAKHFNAVLLPCGGTVTACGYDTAEEQHLFDIRQNVGLVLQNPDNQLVATIVEEDVAFAPENLGVPPIEIRERVDYALKAVDMAEYKGHAPHQLSGGQKQRVAIAGIIAMQPKCIVLDEPTAMLDPKGRKEVVDTIHSLNKNNGTTIVLITHYMSEAVNADRVIVLDEGEIVCNGTPKEVFSQVELLKNIGLDVPPVTDLAFKLKKRGINIDSDILTQTECVEELSKLLEESGCLKS